MGGSFCQSAVERVCISFKHTSCAEAVIYWHACSRDNLINWLCWAEEGLRQTFYFRDLTQTRKNNFESYVKGVYIMRSEVSRAC